MLWTEYAGVPVLDFETSPKGRHPRWGNQKLIPIDGTVLLALEDGTYIVVCSDCPFNGITGNKPYVMPEGEHKPILDQVNSVSSHRSGTHNRKGERRLPYYTDEEIVLAIQVFLKWKASGAFKWLKCAVQELEQRGFKTYRGGKMTSSGLSSLVNGYITKPEFKDVKADGLDSHDDLAKLVLTSAAENSNRKSSLANAARITEIKKPHKHTPVNFDQIIADQQAAAAQDGQKDTEEKAIVPQTPTHPTLTFAGPTQQSDKSILVERVKRIAESPVLAPVETTPDPVFDFLLEVAGEPVFKYKGKLFVGKPVRSVEA